MTEKTRKVIFYCDNGANIHSTQKEIVDPVNDWGVDNWDEMTEEEKQKVALEWAYEYLDIGYKEIEND